MEPCTIDVSDWTKIGFAKGGGVGCIADDRQTHSATRTWLTNTPRDAEPFRL